MDSTTVSLRAYDPRDDDAIQALHQWAIAETGVDPADIPGTEDLQQIQASYLEPGGGFVVGTVPTSHRPDSTPAEQKLTKLTTYDGTLVAMGGYLPNEVGHSDERDRPGAAELHRMRVAPPYQRHGFGRQLLDELEHRAATAGFELLLATTSTRQPAALEFYPEHGYEQVATSAVDSYELVHFEKEL